MKANEVIKKVLDEHGEITEVYWVACGGSLIDLYPSHFLMNVESAKTSSGWHTAKEFLVATPKKLGKHSLVVMCSHSGNTKEAVDAAVLAYERGAAVVTLTDNAGSKADDPRFIAWVYPLAHQNSAIIPKPDKKPMARFKRPEANSPANIIFPGWRRSASMPLRNCPVP